MATTMLTSPHLVTDGNQDRLIVDMSDKIYLLDPEATPFTTLTTKMRTMPTNQYEYKWREEDPHPLFTQANGAIVLDATALVVDDDTAQYFKPGDHIYAPATGEVMRVTAIDTVTHTLTVIRHWGTSAAGLGIADDAYIFNIGDAMPENSLRPDIRMVIDQTITNYTQIFRHPFGISRTAATVAEYGGPRLPHLRARAGVAFKRMLEYSALFGVKSATTVGTDQIRTTDGLLARITTNRVDLGNTVTAGGFNLALETLFEWGNPTKWMFCGNRLLTLISQIANNRLDLRLGDDTFGLAVYTWLAPHGKLNIVRHPMLTHAYSTQGIVLDMDEDLVAWRPLVGNGYNAGVQLRPNLQERDRDGFVEEWFCEGGWMLRQEKRHGLLYAAANATAAKDTGF